MNSELNGGPQKYSYVLTLESETVTLIGKKDIC